MKKHIIAIGIVLCSLAGCHQNTIPTEIHLSDYTQGIDIAKDATLAVRKAMEACRETGAGKLIIDPGTYYFLPNLAEEKYMYVSNNDEGQKRVLFNLSSMKNFEIEGNGANLLFTGYITPFLIDSAENITIKNLSIDYTRTFHSEGRISKVGDGWVDLLFSQDYPYRIENGCLYFYDAQGTEYPVSNLLEFDVNLREPAFNASDYWLSKSTIPAEEQSDGTVRIFKEKLTGTVGNIMVLGAGHRLNPAFIVSDSRQLNIANVNLYHSGGMGVIAQRSGDIELNKLIIIPSPGKDRVVSITADATHYSNCYGYIRMIDCVFTNQKDDATNIHGIYPAIADIDRDNNTLTLELMHSAQWGFDFIKPGTTLEFVDQETLLTYYEGKVKSVERLNKEYTKVTFEEPLPQQIALKHVVASVDAYPEVLIKGCRFEKNRARGLLLGSRGKMVIEDNFFHIAGAAILFEGDGRYWYEQSGVRDVTIRRNTFENGNYGYFNWGRACIAVGSGLNNREDSYYHRNITIEDNTFRVFDPRILNLYCVDSLVFKNNIIEKTTAYPNLQKETRPFVYTDCQNITIEE